MGVNLRNLPETIMRTSRGGIVTHYTGGLRSVVAESTLVRHQVLILNRGRKRAPNLRVCGSHRRRFAHPLHEPGTHPPFRHRSEALYLAAFAQPVEETEVWHAVSSQRGRRPGPKGPNKELIDAVAAMKQRNPSWGCPRNCPADCLSFRRGDR